MLLWEIHDDGGESEHDGEEEMEEESASDHVDDGYDDEQKSESVHDDGEYPVGSADLGHWDTEHRKSYYNLDQFHTVAGHPKIQENSLLLTEERGSFHIRPGFSRRILFANIDYSIAAARRQTMTGKELVPACNWADMRRIHSHKAMLLGFSELIWADTEADVV